MKLRRRVAVVVAHLAAVNSTSLVDGGGSSDGGGVSVPWNRAQGTKARTTLR
jgi:hypothetical protein